MVCVDCQSTTQGKRPRCEPCTLKRQKDLIIKRKTRKALAGECARCPNKPEDSSRSTCYRCGDMTRDQRLAKNRAESVTGRVHKCSECDSTTHNIIRCPRVRYGG